MDDRIIEDILARQADRLIERQPDGAELADERLEELAALAPLMELAQDIQSALTLVEPSPVFVNRLSRQLSDKVVRGSREMSRRARRAILIVAAALGSAVSLVSAVGIVIYLIRQHGRRPPTRLPGET